MEKRYHLPCLPFKRNWKLDTSYHYFRSPTSYPSLFSEFHALPFFRGAICSLVLWILSWSCLCEWYGWCFARTCIWQRSNRLLRGCSGYVNLLWLSQLITVATNEPPDWSPEVVLNLFIFGSYVSLLFFPLKWYHTTLYLIQPNLSTLSIEV